MPTISDIAKACATSKTTVSLVMNGNDRKISRETRDRVLETVRRMEYQPSAVARGLSTKRTNTIGLVNLNEWHILSSSFSSTLLGAIVDEATDREQTVSVFNARVWKSDNPNRLIFADGRCDGLVVTGFSDTNLLPALQRSGVPFVLVNAGEGPQGSYSMDIDNFDAARKAMRYLLEQGHRRIAYLSGAEGTIYSQQRLEGYRCALNECAIPFDPALVLSGEGNFETGYERARLIASHPELSVTALFCWNDALAHGAIRGLGDSGLRVPNDVSVIGIDGTFDGERSFPRLTTVSQSLDKLGAEAVRVLLDIIEGRENNPRHIVWPTELIVRDSVAEPVRA